MARELAAIPPAHHSGPQLDAARQRRCPTDLTIRLGIRSEGEANLSEKARNSFVGMRTSFQIHKTVDCSSRLSSAIEPQHYDQTYIPNNLPDRFARISFSGARHDRSRRAIAAQMCGSRSDRPGVSHEPGTGLDFMGRGADRKVRPGPRLGGAEQPLEPHPGPACPARLR